MAHGWTLARKRKQSAAIHRWKPWLHSTGPRTSEGKAKVARNPFKGGQRALCARLARLLRELRRSRTEV